MFKINELINSSSGISIDSRTIKPGNAFIALKGPNFDGHDFIAEAIKKQASYIIAERTPLMPQHKKIRIVKVKDTLKALGDIARFKRDQCGLPVIGVTGSNGKTTTKEMIAGVLSKKFKVLKNAGTKNNHIGLPLTLLGLDKSHDVAVLEIGTNHFGEVKYLAEIAQPNIGIITNIGPSHLEFFKHERGVLREKYSLIKNLIPPHIAILNADNNLLKISIAKISKKPFILGFGMKNNCDFFAGGIRVILGSLEFCVNKKYKFKLKTPGCYNIYNALPAIAAGRIFGIEYQDIAESLASFVFPEGRLNSITLNRIRFINDTYNSNPFSLKEALRVLADSKVRGRRIFVMGDMLELGYQKYYFHKQAGRQAAKVCDCLIVVGELSKLAAESARESGLPKKNIFACDTPNQASRILFDELCVDSDDLVLVKGSRALKMEEVFKA